MCDGTSCSVAVDESHLFRVDATQQQTQTKEAAAVARLLIQGTFGPSNSSIEAALGAVGRDPTADSDDDDTAVAAAWVAAEMAQPPALLRAHFRQRFNPRLFHESLYGGTTSPCDDGSRWNRFAFDHLDLGRTIEVTSDPVAEAFVVSAGAVVRTKVASWGGSQWPGRCECIDDGSWGTFCTSTIYGNEYSEYAAPDREWCFVKNALYCGDTKGLKHLYLGRAPANYGPMAKSSWSYNACNIPTAAGASHILLRAGHECQEWQGQHEFGTQSSVEACAQRCRDFAGCEYFLFAPSSSSRAGACYKEATGVDENCGPGGFYATDMDLYRLDDTIVSSDAETRPGVLSTGDPVRYTICDVEEESGGYLAIMPDSPGNTCSERHRSASNLFAPHPPIEFGTSVAASTQIYSPGEVTADPVWTTDSVLLRGHTASCTGSSEGGNVFIGIGTTPTPVFYRYDRRMTFVDNAPDAPADVSFGEQAAARNGVCPVVPRTALNEDSCVRRTGDSCGQPTFSPAASIALDHQTLQAWFAQSSKYVYAIRGLRFEAGRSSRQPPCSPGQSSRWIKVAASEGCSSLLDDGTGPTTHTIPWGFGVSLTALTIAAGDTVRWTWSLDSDRHDVVSGQRPNPDGTFCSPYQSSGFFAHTFTEVGAFPYFCTPHPGMDAVITVLEAVTNPAVVLGGPTADAVVAAIDGGKVTWRRCAGEGGTCACTTTVKYGVGTPRECPLSRRHGSFGGRGNPECSDWVYAEPASSGQTSCSDSVFGNPKHETYKACYCLEMVPSTNPTIRDVVVSSYHDASNDVLGHVLLQQGGQCASSEADHFFGYFPGVEACARQCRYRVGCTLFRYYPAATDCRQQGAMYADDCGPGGFSASAYDSYKLDDAIDENECSLADSTIGAHVADGNGACWRHSHPNEGSVYDFSRWSISHPGNNVPNLLLQPNPFIRPGEDGLSDLNYPGWHDMARWEESVAGKTMWSAFTESIVFDIVHVGDFGDVMDFADMPRSLQTREMAAWVGATADYPDIGFEACGSRGEVANEPTMGARYSFSYGNTDRDELGYQGLDQFGSDHRSNRHMLWTTVVLNAPDQLRQRTAWALSQIFSVGAPNFDFERVTEPWAVYYDIFVSHAFGNYRDILREVAASPLMGKYLTLVGNSAYAYNGGRFPDENFAREIMQLFTVGLWRLNLDGTRQRDGSGELLETYTNDDIMAFARVWTGWDVQPSRGNFAAVNEAYNQNPIDPMKLFADRRDTYPKTLLGGWAAGYLGDAYPLCSQLPPRHFLQAGAKFRYHGEASMLGEVHDNADELPSVREHMTPDPVHSALYAQLCQRDAGGEQKCTFPPVVTLSSDLTCHGDAECGAELLRAVKIIDGDTSGYYTYVEPPCTRLQFFEGQRARYDEAGVCADPTVASTVGVQCCHDPSTQLEAGPVCPEEHPFYQRNTGQPYSDICYSAAWRWSCPLGCQQSGDNRRCLLESDAASLCHLNLGGGLAAGGEECLFTAEPVKLATAESRCASVDAVLCPPNNYDRQPVDWRPTCGGYQFAWTNAPCTVQVQIFPSGEVSIVDRVSWDGDMGTHSGNKFNVHWGSSAEDSDAFPTFTSNCAAGCQVMSDGGGSCICDVDVVDAPFASDTVPTEAELRAALAIGAPAPEQLGSDYTLCTAAMCTAQPGVRVHTREPGDGSSTSGFDIDAIFEFVETATPLRPSSRNPAKYLLNRISTVHVGSSTEFQLLPPRFLAITSCSASSEDSSAVGCGAAIDGSVWQSWVTTIGAPLPAWIQLNFDVPEVVAVMDFKSLNLEHQRGKQVLLEFSDGSSQHLTLDNSGDPRAYPLTDAVTTRYVKVTIESNYIAACVFPVTHNSIVYAGCISDVNDPWGRNLDWCATEVGVDGTHANWGNCDIDGVNTLEGLRVGWTMTGAMEIRFHEPGTGNTYSSTSCEDAGLLPVSQTECESARPQLIPAANPDAQNSMAGLVGSWGHIPAGCSHNVGDALDGSTAWRNHEPFWNVRPAALLWETNLWPVCRTPVTGSTHTGFHFRNPPHFLPNLGEMMWWIPGGVEKHPYGDGDHLLAPAEHETNVLIDHLFEHDNTAPFVAHRMIQRLITSNPSPRYVRAVAMAFQTGEHGGTTYSGRYGCMAATVAAIMLDREARSSLLDLEPTHGQLREPILKVLHLMRSME